MGLFRQEESSLVLVGLQGESLSSLYRFLSG